jgi:hypothetical protein
MMLLKPIKQIEGPSLTVKRNHFSNSDLAELEKLAHKANLDYVFDLVFENGAVYRGYMNDGVREGPGVQSWPDGARYEGNWHDNRTFGKGKFWHSDGDIYDGEWADDKANGYGIYWHLNGAKYEGQWLEDL